MSPKAVKTLWGFFGLFGLTFSMLAWLRTTGQDTEADIFGILKLAPAAVPALAFPMQLGLLAIVFWLTRVWATEVGGKIWAARLPIFYFESDDIDSEARGGNLYQGACAALFLVIPFSLLINIGAHYLEAKVYFVVDGGRTIEVTGNWWLRHFDWQYMRAFAGSKGGWFRFASPDGPQYYPALTWAYAVAFVGLFAYVVVIGCDLVLGRRRSPRWLHQVPE